jgi:hypothetical protein
LAELDARSELAGEDAVDVTGAVYDLDDSSDREHYLGERLQVEPERDQPTATVVDDDGEERDRYDLDDSDQRAALIDARLAGEDVAGFDSSYESIEGDE